MVLNKRYFAFTFPIDFAMVMSPQAASDLDGVSASRHKNKAPSVTAGAECMVTHLPFFFIRKRPHPEILPIRCPEAHTYAACTERIRGYDGPPHR